MSTLDRLAALLTQIDGAGYGAYKRIRGSWVGHDVELSIDRVQGDPFATPSVVRIGLPAAGYEEAIGGSRARRTAACDRITRRFADRLATLDRGGGSGRSGALQIDGGAATILRRASCEFVGDRLELRFRVGLPARGRRVLGRAAATLLTESLPRAAASMRQANLDDDRLEAWMRSAEEHAHLQSQLAEAGLVAFVADGSILPRQHGASWQPLSTAVPLVAPPELKVTLRGLDDQPIVGLGVPHGITVITGGGFHGKTTLLQAIAAGIHPHIPGDGRERVVTDASAVKVRSEDGRSINAVNLGPFIGALPGRADTERFDTADASGSTSLAAAILESLELGATSLLLDEDTCATNLLIRDARMQRLVRHESIVPLIDRVQQLHQDLGTSTVLVLGGSGDYLEVADTVIAMEAYVPHEVTTEARAVVDALPTARTPQPPLPRWQREARSPRSRSLRPHRASGRPRVRAHGTRDLTYGDDVVDLGGLEQLVEQSQARLIGVLLQHLGNGSATGTLLERVQTARQTLERDGLYALGESPELVEVRALELGAAINRLRTLEIE